MIIKSKVNLNIEYILVNSEPAIMNSINSETSVSREGVDSVLTKNYLDYQKEQGRWTVMPCPSTGPKIIWASPNILCQTKN